MQDKPNATRGTTRIGASERNIDGSMREVDLNKTKGKIKEFGIRDNIFEYGTRFMQNKR